MMHQGRLQLGYTDAYNIVGALVLRLASAFHQASTATVTLSGSVSRSTTANITAYSSGVGVGAAVALNTSLRNLWGAPPSPLQLTVYVVTTCPGATVAISQRDYSYVISVPLLAGRTLQCAIAVSLDGLRGNATLADTTATINKWLAEVAPPPTATRTAALVRMYYQSWFSFWYNTEHALDHWGSPVITPSKSTYGRGMWLWDSAFHIFALVHGGASALDIATAQVRVLVAGAAATGHLPREVWAGAASIDIQAPGVLTWAALLIHARTGADMHARHVVLHNAGDLSLIEDCYETLAANNRWFYATRDPDGDGLCEASHDLFAANGSSGRGRIQGGIPVHGLYRL
jgi:hypothetical protein